MEITVEDRYPGAGPGRASYLEDRTRRTLGELDHALAVVVVGVARDVQDPTHCEVRIRAQTSRRASIEAVARRRLLPDALADAFDALVARLELAGILRPGEPDDEHEDEDQDQDDDLRYSPFDEPGASRRPSAY
ncbi:MAG: hypothetical protein KDK70_30245 [Myxococcales bacterium]|nr:hypothetical protein [Myxococcales bacterium]